MNADTQREEDLFDAARKLTDPGKRKAYLDRACGSDQALRLRLEDLLAAESAAEEFFDEIGTTVTSAAAQLNFSQDLAGATDASAGSSPGEEPIGTRIGRYKLLQKIGEGGCGVVYMAEQEEPVRRRVALKIIKLGMETKSVIARFEAERQALAMMDHPNIARVFDAGATDRGPPYFVMELVQGVKITEYCDQNRLDIQQRLDLFIQICHAIQHAHQKGIIHRDIKPSNIMVALHDGVPVPKVIDFGISKATEARLADGISSTAFAQLIGTPAYMSPEQAEMNRLDVDTRSDIYSLGVLLYELLTGRTPFEAKKLQAMGLDDMRRTLREREPPKPSARLDQLNVEALIKAAGDRQTEPAKLISLLRGDLDWVVMKTLEKDRRRRYETANGLAMDIQRHRNFEPVAARPPSWLYQFQKLVRRNRVIFAAGGAVTLALMAGFGTSTWLFLKEREARQRAVAAEQQQARLRVEAEGREKITQAALLVSLEKFKEAEAMLHEVSLTLPTVEGAAVFRSLGEWHALENRWREAADRFGRLQQVDQLDGADVLTLDYLRCGPALVEADDMAGYESFRLEAISRFSANPNPFADRIVKVSLLRPAGEKVLEAMRSIAEANGKSLAQADADRDAFQAAWRSVSLALWEYRRANYAKAVEWCERCLAYPDVNAPRAATARAILALAYHQQGRQEDARTELAVGREIFESKFKSRADRGTPVQGFWFDWAFGRILLREAAALIETGSRSSL